MLWSFPYATGDPKCIPGAKCMTQILLSYSTDLNCILLVALQNQTCETQQKALLFSGRGSTSESGSAHSAWLRYRYDSPAPGVLPWSRSWLLWVHLRSAGVSAQGWPGHLSLLQGPVKGALEDRVASWWCTVPSPHGSAGEERTKLTSLQRSRSAAASFGVPRV